ncbi:MAG: hypothetical protein QW478_04930 [Candidatus Micrarchaeaceae archaeon]
MGKKQPNLCEHEFEERDPHNTNYSLLEYDLVARLNLSLRKNFKENTYELFKIDTGKVIRSFKTLEDAADYANYLENNNSIVVGCGYLCPKRRKSF